MELWWWIEPLFYTGLVTFLIAAFVGMITDFDSRVACVITLILLLPLGAAIVSTVAWVLAFIFTEIWSPYF